MADKKNVYASHSNSIYSKSLKTLGFFLHLFRSRFEMFDCRKLLINGNTIGLSLNLTVLNYFWAENPEQCLAPLYHTKFPNLMATRFAMKRIIFLRSMVVVFMSQTDGVNNENDFCQCKFEINIKSLYCLVFQQISSYLEILEWITENTIEYYC